jgi:hypothetical protein
MLLLRLLELPMSGKETVEALTKKVQSIKDRFERLDKEVRGLKDVLNIRDNWNAEVRQWVDKGIKLRTTDGEDAQGILKWIDRYNICVLILDKPRVYNKGGITWIEPQ